MGLEIGAQPLHKKDTTTGASKANHASDIPEEASVLLAQQTTPLPAVELLAFNQLAEIPKAGLARKKMPNEYAKELTPIVIPAMTQQEQSEILRLLNPNTKNGLLDTVINNKAEIDQAIAKPNQADEDKAVLDLKLLNSKNAELNKRVTFYIADIFKETKHLPSEEQINIIKALLSNLEQAIQKAKTNVQEPAKKARVAILDVNLVKVLDVDGDGKNDFTHAQAVELAIKSEYPKAETVLFALDEDENGIYKSESIPREFNNLKTRLRRGEHFDAANFSFGRQFRIEKMGKVKVIPDNIDQHKEAKTYWRDILKSALSTAPVDTLRLDALRNIGLIEDLQNYTPVYLPSGNEGPNFMDIESIAQGDKVHVCAATNKDGRFEKYSGKNIFVTDTGGGSFELREISDPNSKELIGYDFNSDGNVDVQKDDVRLSKGRPTTRKFVGKTEASLRSTLSLESITGIISPKENNPNDFFNFTKNQLLPVDNNVRTILGDDLKSDYFGDFIEIEPDGKRIKEGYRLREGRIVYDPLNSGRDNIVNVTFGTSFVGPNIIGKKLAEKYGEK